MPQPRTTSPARYFDGVPKPVMVNRTLRVPPKLWEAAKAKADERDENISDVIRDALERYVKRK